MNNRISVFIKLIFGYIFIIVCNIFFGVILITPTWNELCKNISIKPFCPKPGDNQKLNSKNSIFINIGIV